MFQKNATTVRRATKCSLKYADAEKLEKLGRFMDDYMKLVEGYVDLFWPLDPLPRKRTQPYNELMAQSKSTTSLLNASWHYAAAEQAMASVLGTREALERLNAKRISDQTYLAGLSSRTQKQEKKLRKLAVPFTASKPGTEEPLKRRMVLGDHCARLSLCDGYEFDAFLILLGADGRGSQLALPTRLHEHYWRLRHDYFGNMKNTFEVTESSVCLTFEIEKPLLRDEGLDLGIDVGIKTPLALSNGVCLGDDIRCLSEQLLHCRKERKTRVRKKERSVPSHRERRLMIAIEHAAGAAVRELMELKPRRIVMERLKDIKRDLRYKQGVARERRHTDAHSEECKTQERKDKHLRRLCDVWRYAYLLNRIELACEVNGVEFIQVSAFNTSRMCSQCGYIAQASRVTQDLFHCVKCGFECHADVNAAKNILDRGCPGSLLLPSAGKDTEIKEKKDGQLCADIVSRAVVPA